MEYSLKEYEKGLYWSAGSRRKEVQGYYKFHSQAKILAFTFLKGDDTSSLNRVLLQKVIEAMKADLNNPSEKQPHPGNRLVLQFNMLENKEFYIKFLKTYAQEPSNIQEPVTAQPVVLHM